MDVLTFFGGSVIGGFIGYFIKYYLDIRYSKKIEELNKKRKLYEDTVDSLNVFISGRNSDIALRDKFLESYARLWLWASDDVIKKIGIYLDNNVRRAEGVSIEEKDMKDSFTQAVVEMRKDIGYTKTKLESGDYKFVSF